MQKARGYQKLPTVFKAQFDAEPLAIARRSLANVQRRIEQPPAPAAHQFGLGMWRGLEMQAPDGAHLRRQRMVVLHEIEMQPLTGQRAFVPALAEKPPRITKSARCQNHRAGKGGLYQHSYLMENHGSVPQFQRSLTTPATRVTPACPKSAL